MESQEKTGASQDRRRTTRPRRLLVVLLVLVVAVTGLWAWRYLSIAFRRVEYATKRATFSDNSDGLRQTVVVPTLETPLPPGRNVIWCSSFQLAWNEVRDKVVGAPLEVVGAEEVAAR